MSENNKTNIESPTDDTEMESKKSCRHHHSHCGKRGRTGRFIMGALAIVGIVSIANIAIGAGACAGKGDPGERANKVAMHMLDDVDASDAQKEQVKSIIQTHKPALKSLRQAGKDTRKEIHTLLSAATVDRAALETLRAKKVASMDEASREMTTMLADIAEVLTPEQRQQVADKMSERFENRRGHHWN
ncbi:Spy/CpxP family protein refolding chaperone [Pseudomonadota bacterium]